MPLDAQVVGTKRENISLYVVKKAVAIAPKRSAAGIGIPLLDRMTVIEREAFRTDPDRVRQELEAAFALSSWSASGDRPPLLDPEEYSNRLVELIGHTFYEIFRKGFIVSVIRDDGGYFLERNRSGGSRDMTARAVDIRGVVDEIREMVR